MRNCWSSSVFVWTKSRFFIFLFIVLLCSLSLSEILLTGFFSFVFTAQVPDDEQFVPDFQSDSCEYLILHPFSQTCGLSVSKWTNFSLINMNFAPNLVRIEKKLHLYIRYFLPESVRGLLLLLSEEELTVPDWDVQLLSILLKFLHPAEDKHHPSSPKAQLWETLPPLLPPSLHFEFNQPIGMGHHMSQASNLISHFPALGPCCRSGLDSSGWGSFGAASHPQKTLLTLPSTLKTPPHALPFLCFWICSRRIQLNYVQRGIL